MHLINIATRRRITVLMAVVAIFLFGLVSLTRLKVNMLPDLSYPTITIRTELTGAAPLEIENLLSKPIEEAVGVIKNVRQVRSVSRSGQSDVILEFLWGTEMDFASVDVREKLDILQLPLEAGRPLLLRFDPSNEPVLRFGLALDDTVGELDDEALELRLKALRRFAEDRLKNELEAVEGTAAVKVSGGLEDEIQVLVDQEKLARLGLSIERVAERIRAENVNLSGGRLEQGSQRFLVRTINEFTSVGEIADAIISTEGGRTVYLRDIATVERGVKEREAVTRVEGRESVELAVYKEGDANTVLIATRVAKRLAELREALPPGMELIDVYDQSRFISEAISQVGSAALLGGLLAVLVLYFFLRDVRSTIIIGCAIPVSIIGTFVLMYSSDVSVNIMSLGGIALAIGMLVDNSIVVLENIVRKREEGKELLEAAQTGTGEVASAVVAATLTTVAVFFPMVFVSGIAGQLFRDQALTVTFALLFSLVVALTVIPMLASWGAGHRFADANAEADANADGERPGLIKRLIARLVALVTRSIAFLLRVLGLIVALVGRVLGFLLRPFVFAFQGLNRAAERAYVPTIGWALNHRFVVVLVAGAAFAGTMTLVPRLGAELIPQLAQGEFAVDVRLAPGTPLEQTDEALQRVQATTEAIDGIDRTYSVAGTGNRLDANPVDAGDNTGKLNVRLTAGAGRDQENATMAAMRERLRRIPGLQYEFSRPALLSFRTPLEVAVSGYDLAALEQVSQRIKEAMEASDRFADVRSTIEAGNPELQIVFDHERAAKLGLLVRDIADRVVTNVRGDIATRYTWEDRKIDVLVRSVDTTQASIDEIRRLIVNPQSDRPVSLDAIADIRVARGPAEIRRTDQERVALLSANLAFGDLGVAAMIASSFS
ncbi:MAG: efflux RND transporter permease subunit, partial [Pseudomonadota bacterium]